VGVTVFLGVSVVVGVSVFVGVIVVVGVAVLVPPLLDKVVDALETAADVRDSDATGESFGMMVDDFTLS
jgi:hypothetical protein